MSMRSLILFSVFLLLLTSCTRRQEPIVEDEPEDDPIVVEPEPIPEEPEPDPVYSRYTGLETTEDLVDQKPLMVMIDNHQNARPQGGLSKASIVYEMRVEGGFTRYAALFEQQVDENLLVGPIRSARPNFVELALQYGVPYAHYGGSQDGLNMIYNYGVTSLEGHALDEIATLRYFETGKFAPHNGYGYLDDFYTYLNDIQYDTNSTFEPFNFHQVFTSYPGDVAEQVQIVYNDAVNVVNYEYDRSQQSYLRYREGEQMLDETSADPVLVTNIIVQISDSYVYTPQGHRAFQSVGEGQGYLITGGTIQDIIWTKSESIDEITQYFTLDQEPIVLNPGQTWVQVIDSWTPITFN